MRDTPHQARLFEEALNSLPQGVETRKAPALRIERKEVFLQVAIPAGLKGSWAKEEKIASDSFCERTGYTLVLSDASGPAKPAETKTPDGAMEINRAYSVIQEAFEGERHAPYRVGLKSDQQGGYIEATFISPSVGERYREKLDELAREVGWSIRIRQSANQEQIALEASRVTPEVCGVRGAPKFYPGEWRVVVPVKELPQSVDREKLVADFEEATGCLIDWECPVS